MSEGGHSKKEYIIIMFVLAALTVVEVVIAKSTTGLTTCTGLLDTVFTTGRQTIVA